MKILFELRNRENDFIGAGFINDDLAETFTFEYYKNIFNSAMIEYDWEEDQSIENCVNILFTTFLILNQDTKNFGFVYNYGFLKSNKAMNFLKNNNYKVKNIYENSSIFFEENWLSYINPDYHITMISATPEVEY